MLQFIYAFCHLLEEKLTCPATSSHQSDWTNFPIYSSGILMYWLDLRGRKRRDIFENFIARVEDLNDFNDVIEKESVTNLIPSPVVPLLKVDLRVNLNWDHRLKVNKLSSSTCGWNAAIQTHWSPLCSQYIAPLWRHWRSWCWFA